MGRVASPPEDAPEPISSPSEPGAGGSGQLEARLAGAGPPLILDGATGTELERAGLSTGLPLWSTHALLEAPERVARIHSDYLRAGAEIVTANTFRTQTRTLERAGLGDRDRDLTRQAVALARESVRQHRTGATGAWVAGSLPPLEDCYRPDLVPPRSDCAREHARQVELLVEAGVDLILIETMNSGAEALEAARAASASGLPFVVGFVAWEPGRLLSGEPLVEAAESVLELGAAAVGVNCVPPSALDENRHLLAAHRFPLLVSPNLGEPLATIGFARREDIDPLAFAEVLHPWLAEPGLRIVGGCCGTSAAHIEALARAVSRSS